MHAQGAVSDSSPAPDDKRLFLLLQKVGLDAEQANTFVQELRTLAAENLIARFEAKLDAHNAAMTARINMLTWVIGVAFALLLALDFLPV